jgi:hypothetical protein
LAEAEMLLVPKAHELESAEKCHTSLKGCVVYQADVSSASRCASGRKLRIHDDQVGARIRDFRIPRENSEPKSS